MRNHQEPLLCLFENNSGLRMKTDSAVLTIHFIKDVKAYIDNTVLFCFCFLFFVLCL